MKEVTLALELLNNLGPRNTEHCNEIDAIFVAVVLVDMVEVGKRGFVSPNVLGQESSVKHHLEVRSR